MSEIQPILPLPLILLVDDHKDSVRLLEEHFLQAGCRVVTASTCGEGIKAVRENDPLKMVLVVDLNLGGTRTGLDFIQEAKRIAPHRVFPIVLTGDTSSKTRRKVLSVGGFHIFYKTKTDESEIVDYALYSTVRTLVDDVMTDHLTGLSAIEPFNIRAIELLRTVARRKKVISLIFWDIDDFHEFNRKHGHGLGDEVLKTFGKILRDHEHFRPDDPVARRGEQSDEFEALLLGATEDVALEICERIKRDVMVARVLKGNIILVPFGVSFGVAQITQEEIRAELAKWPKDKQEEGLQACWKRLQEKAEKYGAHSLDKAKAIKDQRRDEDAAKSLLKTKQLEPAA